MFDVEPLRRPRAPKPRRRTTPQVCTVCRQTVPHELHTDGILRPVQHSRRTIGGAAIECRGWLESGVSR